MLFDEVAIEPKCLLQAGFDIYLKTLFGLDKGRIISKLPRNWVDQVRSEVENLTDEFLKKKLSTLLNSRSFIDSLYDANRKWSITNKEDWLKSIEIAHEHKKFSAILNTSKNDETIFFDLDKIDQYVEKSENRV